jgi:hypothetical protein
MQYRMPWLAALLIIVGLGLAGCAQPSAIKAKKESPAQVVLISKEPKLSQVTLTARAAERLGIQTSPVREAQVRGTQRTVIPYGAVLYDAHGATWTYTSPQPLVFVRHHLTVDFIEGDQVVLADGPPVGMAVVTVGAAELFGTEFEVGH